MIELLISVSNASEARAALLGGADIIDAKNPHRGALAPVDLQTFREIVACVGGGVPVSAALGDADDERAIGARTRAFAAAGAEFVKIGFAGINDRGRVRRLLRAAADAVDQVSRVVPVAYADRSDVDSLDPFAFIEIAAAAGAPAVLLDTASKTGPGVCRLMPDPALRSWIRLAHAAGVMAAVAGRLCADDLPLVRDAGADIAGVRGAACENGRASRVSSDRVLGLRARLSDGTHAAGTGEAAPPLFVSARDVGEGIVGTSELHRRQANVRHL